MTQRVVRISESDYRAILRFEDDGGSPVDIVYEFFPDLLKTPSSDEPENGGGEASRANAVRKLN